MEEELHNILKDYRIDDIIEEYKIIKDGLN